MYHQYDDWIVDYAPFVLDFNSLILLFSIYSIFEQVIRYNLVYDSLGLINRSAVREHRKLFQTWLYKYNLFKNSKYSL